MLQHQLEKPAAAGAGTRILGYYLLGVGLIQLGILVWRPGWSVWSRDGLLFPIEMIGFDSDQAQKAYSLRVCFGLAGSPC